MDALNFDMVEDIALAVERRGFDPTSALGEFEISRLGPLIELLLHLHDWKVEPSSASLLANSPQSHCVLDSKIRTYPVLINNRGLSMGALQISTRFENSDDTPFVQFGLAAQKTAKASGIPLATAQSLVGAMKELRDNVIEHSRNAETGFLVFSGSPGCFEFCVADNGIGVLQSLREHTDYQHLSNSGEAIRIALLDGESRHGRHSGHGVGFSELFRGLRKINGKVRFRSGDHALEVNSDAGTQIDAPLFECSDLTGFLISVMCIDHSQFRP